MRDPQRQRQREKQAPCGEPNVGLDPGIPGLHPEPKADAQPLSHPGIPACLFFSALSGLASGSELDGQVWAGLHS